MSATSLNNWSQCNVLPRALAGECTASAASVSRPFGLRAGSGADGGGRGVEVVRDGCDRTGQQQPACVASVIALWQLPTPCDWPQQQDGGHCGSAHRPASVPLPSSPPATRAIVLPAWGSPCGSSARLCASSKNERQAQSSGCGDAEGTRQSPARHQPAEPTSRRRSAHDHTPTTAASA